MLCARLAQFLNTFCRLQLLILAVIFTMHNALSHDADVPSEMLVRTRVKDAICDAIRDAGRPKPLPPAPEESPDLPLFISCFQVPYMSAGWLPSLL